MTSTARITRHSNSTKGPRGGESDVDGWTLLIWPPPTRSGFYHLAFVDASVQYYSNKNVLTLTSDVDKSHQYPFLQVNYYAPTANPSASDWSRVHSASREELLSVF